MNAATSQEVFAGPYLTAAGPEVRQKFGDAFIDMTVGFLAFPLCLPGTAVWRGRRGRLYILSVLRVAAAQSKAAMKARGPRNTLFSGLTVRCPLAPSHLGVHVVSNPSLLLR
jgi:cytochrome P450 family 710 subfamily A protein